MQQPVRSKIVQAGARERLAVVVREGLRGNHLLFDARDLAACAPSPQTRSAEVARELGRVGIALARAPSLDRARDLIAACTADCRRELVRLYLDFLGRCASAQGNAS